MRKLFFLFCCLPFINYAQRSTMKRPEEFVIKNPYNEVYFADKMNYANIESITVISKHKRNNFAVDTSQLTYYDDKGLKIKTIDYQDNQRNQTTLMTYNDDETLNNWEIIFPKYREQTFYEYDTQQRIISTRQTKTRQINGELVTSELSKIAFIYNDFGLSEIRREGALQGKETYEYDGQRLIKYWGVGIIKEFTYNDDSTLLLYVEYMGEIGPTKLMTVQKFEYDDDKNLVMDSVVTTSNREKGEFQKTNYTYINHQLETMEVSFGNLYRNLQFEYLSDKIKKITVETNGNSAYLRTWMPYRIPDFYSFPLTYSEVFDYDDFGNKIARRIYVNDELFSETEFIIKYQKD
jgi:hypothetical protein